MATSLRYLLAMASPAASSGALSADTIFELVQQANGIGSGGIFVLVVFGLFSGIGGARAALACLAAGTAVWALLTYGWKGCPAPYLASLLAALMAFLGVALWERRRAPPES